MHGKMTSLHSEKGGEKWSSCRCLTISLVIEKFLLYQHRQFRNRNIFVENKALGGIRMAILFHVLISQDNVISYILASSM